MREMVSRMGRSGSAAVGNGSCKRVTGMQERRRCIAEARKESRPVCFCAQFEIGDNNGVPSDYLNTSVSEGAPEIRTV